MKTLIVEDDLSFRKIVEIKLRAWNSDIEFTFAESLAAAKVILDNESSDFALVILDQNLPDGLGWTLFEHPKLKLSAVLAVSADNSPELPGQTVKAGAQHFLAKRQVTEPLFVPLVEAIMERSRLERELLESKIQTSRLETIKILLATLRHEINNPLGAVLGGTYLLRSTGKLGQEQEQALNIIEGSSNRIKEVVQQLCDAAQLTEVTKAHETVFHVPGDAPWEGSKKSS